MSVDEPRVILFNFLKVIHVSDLVGVETLAKANEGDVPFCIPSYTGRLAKVASFEGFTHKLDDEGVRPGGVKGVNDGLQKVDT